MTFRDVLLVLHIAGAGTWLGANVVQAVVPGAVARAGTDALAAWYRTTSRLSARLYIPAALLILITGVLLVLRSDEYGFASNFVTVGFAMIFVGAVLGRLVFEPGGEATASAVESGKGDEVRSAAGRLAGFGVLDTLLLLFTITVMVLRWD